MVLRLGIALFGTVALFGCSPKDQATPGGAGGGGQLEISCSSKAGSHDAPAIVVDRAIVCANSYFFGDFGVHVITAPASSFVSASSESQQALFDVTAADAHWLKALPLTPSSSAGTLPLAVDPSGVLYAAAHELKRPDHPGGVSVARLQGEAFAKETVYDTPALLVDLAFDRSGTGHVWYAAGDGPNSPVKLDVAHRASDGQWTHEVVTAPGAAWWRFAVANDDKPVAFGLLQHKGSEDYDYQIMASYDGKVSAFGTPFHTLGDPGFRPLGLNLAAAKGALPAYGAAAAGKNELRVVWSSSKDFVETAVPVTALKAACPIGWSQAAPPCAADCHETASGMPEQAFAATLGVKELWLAYVESHLDFTVAYAPQSNNVNNNSMICAGNLAGDDKSTSELHLVRVPLDGGAPKEVLALKLEKLERRQPAVADLADVAPVAIHEAAGALTVAMRVYPAMNQPMVRVLRIDEKLLPQ